MSILTGKPLYRGSQIAAVLFFPLATFLLFYFSLEDKVKAPGVVEAAEQIVVRSSVEKTIVEKVHFNNGDFVKKGTPVITFADLQGLATQIKQLHLHLDYLRSHLQKTVRLKVGAADAEIMIEEIKNEINKDEIALEELFTKQNRLTAAAPFDGDITNIHIKPQERAEIGQPLFTLFGEGKKVIRCIVHERDFDYLQAGQEVQIKSELYNYMRHRIYRGKVLSITKYGKLAMELSVPDDYDQLDIYYTVLIEILDGQDKLAVGSSAMCEIIIERKPLFFILVGGR